MRCNATQEHEAGRGPFAALQSRPFLLFWTTILLSLIGHLAGTLLAAGSGSRHRRGRIVVGGVAVYAGLIVLFARSSNPMLSGILILGIGLVAALYGTINDTLLQLQVDEAFRGRVLAVYSMFWGLTPIGSLEAGFLANIIGVQSALAINGIIILIYAPLLW